MYKFIIFLITFAFSYSVLADTKNTAKEKLTEKVEAVVEKADNVINSSTDEDKKEDNEEQK